MWRGAIIADALDAPGLSVRGCGCARGATGLDRAREPDQADQKSGRNHRDEESDLVDQHERAHVIVGIGSVSVSAFVVKRGRMNSKSARMDKAAVANTRGSTLLMLRPTSGVSRMANNPTGASTQPAQVAV